MADIEFMSQEPSTVSYGYGTRDHNYNTQGTKIMAEQKKTSFKKASKTQQKLRLALTGVSGSGKTYTALQIAKNLNAGRIALIDTEHGSASLYADMFDFDTVQLDSFSPENYERALHEAELGEYGVVIIDSLSHAWAGKDGILEIVDKATENSSKKNSYQSWSVGTKKQNLLIETLLSTPLHLIVTMRSKADYILEQGTNGKTAPRKVGMAPVQREGVDYEFAIVGDLNVKHNMEITKTRCSLIPEEAIYEKPGKEFADLLVKWLSDGSAIDPRDEILNEILRALKSMAEKFGEKGRADSLKILQSVFGASEWEKIKALPLEVLKREVVNVKTSVKEYLETTV